ncbi:hypothetical protein COO60DRAFT_1482757 [Scenedesmus sp. NREL 46B-D3]|nr:hypothetical protein COO60DRAFT_1482757 [Scenedesmus sp. NREL 46B-D3]
MKCLHTALLASLNHAIEPCLLLMSPFCLWVTFSHSHILEVTCFFAAALECTLTCCFPLSSAAFFTCMMGNFARHARSAQHTGATSPSSYADLLQ